MFEKRGLLIYTHEISDYWRDLLIRSGLNLVAIHPVGGPNAAESLSNLLEVVKTDQFKKFAESLVSHGFTFEYEFHALSWLVPRKWFETKPEWFRMNENGERVSDFNICPSNQEALAYLRERSAELAAQLPYNSNRYFFWLDDVRNASCHCEHCRDLSPSDQALILHNHILEGVQKHNKEATACYLAYQDTIPVPKKIRPNPGIFLEYAPIFRNSAIPMSDSSCPENVKEASHIDELLQFFGKKDSQVLEYWIDNSRFCNWTYPLKKMEINLDVIREDVRFYMSKGFSSATSFACYLGEDYAKEFGIPPIREYAQALKGE